MRKLILQMQMSADGFVDSADFNKPWMLWDWGDHWTWDQDLKKEFNAIMHSSDCILLSRKMVEQGYVDHWSHAAKKFPHNPHYAFAKRVVEVQKIVLTNKLKESTWGRTKIAHDGIVDEVHALKRQKGKNIIAFGGVGFARALVKHALIDEFQFFINPIALGRGASLFETSGPQKLKHLDTTAYNCGIVVSRYGAIK